MLKKLFVYELRACWRILLISYAAVAAMAALATLIGTRLRVPLYSVTFSGLLMLCGFAALIITYVVLVLRFYRGLFGSEGYFWMTLPVPANKLYFSRLLNSVAWASFATLLCTSAFALSMWLLSLRPELREELQAFFHSLRPMLTPGFAVVSLCLLVISQATFFASVYFAIAISNLRPFQSLGVGAAVLAYLVYYTLTQILHFALALFVPLSVTYVYGEGWQLQFSSLYQNMDFLLSQSTSSEWVPGMTLPPIGIAGFLLEIVLFFVLSAVTLRLLRNKVNLR